MPSGLPDLIVCYRGYYAGIEAKEPGKDAKPRQAYVHRKIREAGGVVRVAHNVPEALAVLDEIDSLADAHRSSQSFQQETRD